MKKILHFFLLFTTASLAHPSNAHAQLFKNWDQVVSGCVIDGVPTLRCLPAVFGNLINAGIAFVGVVAVILIVYSGIRLITSGGDPKKVAGARQIMTYAIIGLVLVLSSFAIVLFIGYATGSSDCIGDLNNIASGCK